MNESIDYYQLLHVDPDAPAAIIRASYRTLMQALKQHPDLGGDHDQATLINVAYTTLSDPEKRRAYDAQRSRSPTPVLDAARSAQRRQPLPVQRCKFCALPHALGTDLAADAVCDRCAAPLRSVQRLAETIAGQRALARYPKRAPVQVALAWNTPAMPGTSLDVSLQGMLLELPRPVAGGALLKLSCALLDATGRVVYARAAGTSWQAGVEFQTLRFLQAKGAFVTTRA